MSKQRIQTPSIDIKHVHYFLMLAEHGTISKAANALGLAQPSLSEQIARLEKKLSTRLAIRGPRGVTLTEAGHMLAREGHTLVEAAECLADSLRLLGNDVSGSVSVGLPPSLSAILSIPLAETMRVEMPGIKLHITEGLSGHVLDWIEQDIVDFGFVYIDPQRASLQTEPILREEMFLISAHDNVPVAPDENGNYIMQASALSELPLAMPSMPHSARRAIERFARANNIDLNVVLEIDSLSQIIEMVGRASAYTFLPHGPVAHAVEAGKLALVRITEPSFYRTAYLTRKLSRPASMASLKVETTILQIIRELVARYDLHAQLASESLALQN